VATAFLPKLCVNVTNENASLGVIGIDPFSQISTDSVRQSSMNSTHCLTLDPPTVKVSDARLSPREVSNRWTYCCSGKRERENGRRRNRLLMHYLLIESFVAIPVICRDYSQLSKDNMKRQKTKTKKKRTTEMKGKRVREREERKGRFRCITGDFDKKKKEPTTSTTIRRTSTER
jgi:hypothetical protein